VNELDPEALLRELAEERVPPESPDVQARRRDQIVPTLGSVIRRAHEQSLRRTRWKRAAASLSAAAVFCGLIGAVYHLHVTQQSSVAVANAAQAAQLKDVKGALVVTHTGRSRVVASGEQLQLTGGDELRTPSDGSAVVQTERSQIRVNAATQLDFFAPSAAEERIRVAAGSVDLKVSKVPQSWRSVVVETPNAEVVVRGTMFNVAVAKEQGSTVTRVRVTEGAVWVLHDGERDLVSAGEEWSSRAAAKAAAPPPVAAPAPPPSAPIEAPRGGARTARETAKPSTSSTLSEQNQMYQSALDARNQGDDRRALELFQALLTRHPGGHFAQDAEIERMRAYRRLGNQRQAAAEARRYLARHPAGYAREEARAMALGAD